MTTAGGGPAVEAELVDAGRPCPGPVPEHAGLSVEALELVTIDLARGNPEGS
jgi:hypothetical protein